MTTPAQRSLAELLTELESAVRASERARATTLDQAILQHLATAIAWNARSVP